jgi:beta-lactam-binding protein with PASTA domain
MTIMIRPSSGWTGFTMPDVTTQDYTESEALTSLRNLGATSVTVQCTVTSDTHAPKLGYVVMQNPLPGAAVHATDPIILTLLKTSCLR